jgi:aspartate kinase
MERMKRGGLVFVGSQRHVKANNKYMETYDDTKESNYLTYQDEESLVILVKELLRDPARCRAISETARTHILNQHTYSHRANEIIKIIDIDSEKKKILPEFIVSALVTQGFIGGTSENYTTTLGREGSDYTAALLAYFLDAKQIVIWKDVPGVLNADPKYFKNTKKIDELSYHDAIELTYFGTSVIHPKTIKPLQNKNIPLFVRSFLKPDDIGTVIKNINKRNTATSYIFKTDQLLISIQPKDFSFIAEENLSLIFSVFSKNNVRVNMMQNSAISFSVCIDNDKYKFDNLLLELQTQFKVLYNDNVQLMTIRNYNQETITKLSENKIILIEQRSRNNYQMVIKEME